MVWSADPLPIADEMCSMPSMPSVSSGSPDSEARWWVLTVVASLKDRLVVAVSMTWSTGDLSESARSCILTPFSSWEVDELELDRDGVGAEVGW